MCCLAPWESSAQIAAKPELPRTFLNTTYPVRTGRTITLLARDDLQDALNKAKPGDEIVLPAGATYSGNFVLPRKPSAPGASSADAVIVVRTSAVGALPAGRRVRPADTVAMARVMTPRNGAEAIGTAPGTSGWRLVGLEITAAPSVTLINRLVRFGDGSAAQSTLASVPSNLVLDRSYVHAGPQLDLRRCIDLQSASTAVIDSYVSGCHSANGESQAIVGYNGPGPYKIVNNYLEASGENLMFGGSDVSIPGQMPSDIEVRHNYFCKPLSWKLDEPTYAGAAYIVKNIFELKMGQRVLVEGNVFENSWVQGQVGFALLLKTANGQHLLTSDVTVRNNIIRGAAGGINIVGVDGMLSRISIDNNLLLDIGVRRWGDNGRLFQISNVNDLTITHNTGFSPGVLLGVEPPASRRLTFVGNVVSQGAYGVKSSGVLAGTASLAAAAPGYVFAGNVLIGGTSIVYPPGNFLEPDPSRVGFLNVRSEDFSLSRLSPFAKRAGDGTDPGIDRDALLRATTGVKP